MNENKTKRINSALCKTISAPIIEKLNRENMTMKKLSLIADGSTNCISRILSGRAPNFTLGCKIISNLDLNPVQMLDLIEKIGSLYEKKLRNPNKIKGDL